MGTVEAYRMKTYGQRLDWAMKRKSVSQSELARRVGITQQTVNHLLSEGKKSGHTAKIAEILGVNPNWLATGEGRATQEGPADRGVPVVGYVGAGAKIYPVDDHAKGAGLEMVPSPPGFEGECVAARVRGNSQYPQIEDGWVIYWSRDPYGVPDSAIGRLCAVEVSPGGEMMVKKVYRGSKPGLFRLDSVNSPPIEDVRLTWASPILFILPR